MFNHNIVRVSFLAAIAWVGVAIAVPARDVASGVPIDGTLDLAFGNNGIVIDDLVNHNDVVTDVAIQSDGKIVVVGYGFSQQTYNDFLIARYNTDGTLDQTFNGTGYVSGAFGSSVDEGLSVVIQSDGKIVIGVSTYVAGKYSFGIARYLADGTPDNDFGTSGKVVTSVSASNDYLADIAIQPDGKIIAVGQSSISTDSSIAFVQYTSAGVLDDDFGINGIRNELSLTTWDLPTSITLQTDGKIILCGRIDGKLGMFRLHPSGSLDTSFADNGYFSQDTGSTCSDVAVQADGNIVAVGTKSTNFQDTRVIIARVTASGVLDSRFGNQGLFMPLVVDASHSSNGEAIYIQPDGKILVSGHATGTTYDAFISKVTTDGALDPEFNQTGISFVDSGVSEYGMALALQPDGKIVQAGFTMSTWNDLFIARYHNSVIESAPVQVGPDSSGINPDSQLDTSRRAASVGAPPTVLYRAGNREVLVSWSYVDGASSYVVTNTKGVVQCTSTALSCTVSGLRNGRAYNYLVHAVNADGVRSISGTSISVRPGFQIKTTTVKTNKKLRITSIASTPSKGVMTWKLTSGKCRFQGTRLVTPAKKGTCTLRLSVKARGKYPAMSTTLTLSVR